MRYGPYEENVVPDRMNEQPLQVTDKKINEKVTEDKSIKNDIFEENSIVKKEPKLVIYEDRIILEDGAPELPNTPASSFSGGKYKGSKLKEDKIYYRAGEAGTPLGQYLSEEMPLGVVQVRIDKAILPKWPSGA
jgi:hypothetical protein